MPREKVNRKLLIVNRNLKSIYHLPLSKDNVFFTIYRKTSGFTILELIVVIAIISILITTGIASYSNVQQKTRDERRKSDLLEIRSALILYFQDFDEFPNTLADPKFFPEYIKTVPQDPAGEPTSDDCSKDNAYCYEFKTIEKFVLWAHLENKNDLDLASNPSALCQESIPDGASTSLNYCLKSPVL